MSKQELKNVLFWKTGPSEVRVAEVAVPKGEAGIKDALYAKAREMFPGCQPNGHYYGSSMGPFDGLVRVIKAPVKKAVQGKQKSEKGKVVNNNLIFDKASRKKGPRLVLKASQETAGGTPNIFHNHIGEGAAPLIVNLNMLAPRINEVVHRYREDHNSEAPGDPEEAKLWSALRDIKAQEIQDDGKLVAELNRHMRQQEIKETIRPLMDKQEELLKQQEETAKQQQETAKKQAETQARLELLAKSMAALINLPPVKPEGPQE